MDSQKVVGPQEDSLRTTLKAKATLFLLYVSWKGAPVAAAVPRAVLSMNVSVGFTLAEVERRREARRVDLKAPQPRAPSRGGRKAADDQPAVLR